jgi:Tol biopolymer transport system component
MIRNSRRPAILAIAVLSTLASLALAPAASATFPDRNGRIAFQAQTSRGVQIFTVRPNGHDLRQITQLDGDATAPDWSPDGRRIAFAFNDCSIAIMDADGSDVSLIADDPSKCQTDPSFTPDGSRLLFEHFDWLGTGADEIWSMKPDGSDKRLVTSAGYIDPNMAPDGRKLSFKGPPVGALFVQNTDGGGLVQVSPTVSVAYKHDWSPDGQRIVFSENSEPGPNDTVNIATVRPDGTDLRYLTHYPAPARAWVGGYSPDGQWIVFRLEDHGRYTLYRVRPDGSDLHPILRASTSFVPRNIDWGPAVGR